MTRPEDTWYGRAVRVNPPGVEKGSRVPSFGYPIDSWRASRALSKSVNGVAESTSEKLDLKLMTMRIFAADLKSCASPGREEEEEEEEEEGGIPRISRRRRGAENE
jgi:hypothetical protein